MYVTTFINILYYNKLHVKILYLLIEILSIKIYHNIIISYLIRAS